MQEGMNAFYIQPRVYFGDDALDRLLALQGKRVFVVADPFVVQSGLIAQVTDRLSKCGAEHTVYSDVVPDPPIESVARGVSALGGFGGDAIVAIGGGSAIDSAKLIREFRKRLDPNAPRMSLIAIPTTSGTGSEVTNVAVVADTQAQVKIPLMSDELLPDEAILSVELVKSVPPALTADTGMDVFTHAVEACVSKNCSDFSAAFSARAIEIVGAYLLRSYLDAGDTHARAKMHRASCLAGLAFNASSLGLNHGMAHALGAKFHLPHGRANAMLLPHVIEFNSGIGACSRGYQGYDRTVQSYMAVARLLGLQSLNANTTVRALVNWVGFMLKEMKMPQSMSQTGVCSEAEYRAAIPAMTEAALADHCTAGNPKEPTAEDVRGIYERLW
jgi:alcohol dehydrogenase class IV